MVLPHPINVLQTVFLGSFREALGLWMFERNRRHPGNQFSACKPILSCLQQACPQLSSEDGLHSSLQPCPNLSRHLFFSHLNAGPLPCSISLISVPSPSCCIPGTPDTDTMSGYKNLPVWILSQTLIVAAPVTIKKIVLVSSVVDGLVLDTLWQYFPEISVFQAFG